MIARRGLVAGFVLCTLLAAGGCQPYHIFRAPPGTVVHVVLVKLKDPAKRDDLMRSCREDLARIGTVRRWTYGPPIDTGRGERVDSAYDVGLTFEFDDAEGYRAYLASGGHAAFIERWQSEFASLRIFDYAEPADPSLR